MPNLKKNLVYNFILSVSQVLMPILSIPYVSRVLDPTGIGRVAFIDSYTYYFISIAEFGIVVYGMREIARVNNDLQARSKLVSELLALHIISSAASLILYGICTALLWHEIRDVRLLLFSLSFLLVNFLACEWYFLGMEKFRYITLRSLLTRIAGLASIFLLVKRPEDYFLYYGIMVVAAIINSVWNNVILFREVGVRFSNINWKKHIRFTRITWLISLTYGVTLMLDNVLLGLVSTATAVGLYAFSMKMVRLSGALLTDSLLVFFPRIVSLIQERDTGRLRAVLSQNLQLIVLLAVPICAGLYLLAEELVLVIFGSSFTPAIADLRILAVFPLLRTYNLFLSKQVLVAFGKEQLYLRSLVAGSAAFIVCCLVLSYYFQDRGCCVALLASELVMLALNHAYARKVTDMQLFDGRSLLHGIMGSLLFIPIIYLARITVDNHLLFVLLISIPVCFAVYVLFQLLIGNEFAITVRRSVSRYFTRLT